VKLTVAAVIIILCSLQLSITRVDNTMIIYPLFTLTKLSSYWNIDTHSVESSCHTIIYS